MTLTTASGYTLHYTILHVFPFTSESKRMGIVVRSSASPPPQTLIDDEGWGAKGGSGEGEGEVLFLQKGADAVMARIVGRNDWLDEECANFAREGLRTLVVGRRRMGRGEYGAFEVAYRAVRFVLCEWERGLIGCRRALRRRRGARGWRVLWRSILREIWNCWG